MAAVGCLSLLVFPIMGFVVGLWMAGMHAAIWSAVAGFAVAALICGVAAYALIKAARQR
jgi:hypothetical protein